MSITNKNLVNSIIKAAGAIDAKPAYLGAQEYGSSFDGQSVARSVAVWATANKAMLLDESPDEAEALAGVAAAEATMKTHAVAAAQARVAVLQKSGGFEGAHALMSAGLPGYDAKLEAEYQRHARAEAAARQDVLAAGLVLSHARRVAMVRQQAAAIVAALIGQL